MREPLLPREPEEGESPACLTCRFYEPPQAALYSQCRRRAPVVVVKRLVEPDGAYKDDAESEWPNTSAEEWCGEWEAFRPYPRPARLVP
jgi:hypothetical protein